MDSTFLSSFLMSPVLTNKLPVVAEEKFSLRLWAMGRGTVDLGRPLFACFWLHFPTVTLLLQLHSGDEVNCAWKLSQSENNSGGECAAFLKKPPGLFHDTMAQRAAPAQWKEHNPTTPSKCCHRKPCLQNHSLIALFSYFLISCASSMEGRRVQM